MKFINLFSGIGAFNQAMKKFDGECVWSCEKNNYSLETYKKNFGIVASKDIRGINVKEIPDHDVLLCSLPPKTFNKSEEKSWYEYSDTDLLFEMTKVIENKNPKYVLFENIKNLAVNENGKTWKKLKEMLNKMGYTTTEKPLLLSPHHFGIPQAKPRSFVAAIKKEFVKDKKFEINFRKKVKKTQNSIETVINRADQYDLKLYEITPNEKEILDAWNDFIKNVEVKDLDFPIWTDHFKTASRIVEKMPISKQNVINKNKELYINNVKFIDSWLAKNYDILRTKSAYRKLDWKSDVNIKNIYDGLIQIKASGIKIQKPNLVQNINSITEVPIYGPMKRRLTLRECARLQSLPEEFEITQNIKQAYKQLNNTVNVTVVENILEKLFEYK
ncbi:DNA (cytosine-5-)-methyltransferase [Spiroplasma sp. BIUS-1]|uniref:DNA (cytosine-5-)-methyltransferase n=1 Tax=Spiroplasma sp. BIUS-1 TaxID=216964 RepID=UPI0013976E6E|nr:DNA (cytosine-5-)-methyltransferase [Spiroplasma sp. BIUS-1]QHX36783.1 DNA (cytosine-5)-methyltransferase 1 [Spiroplasma sp. BIUS-1]